MSNIGSKIEKLIADGFSYNTLRGLSESQINLLYNRLVEQSTPPNTQIINKNVKTYQVKPNSKTMIGNLEIDTTGGSTKVTPMEEEMNEEDDTVTVVDDPDKSADGMGMFESEISEKFESKAQQKLFWAKCNNSRTEKTKKKWCKWAKEFSDKTDFSNLPEKKLEESLTKLVEKYIPESISKKDLMDLIESSTRTKEAPERTKEKEKEKQKPSRKNPFKIEPAQKPGPKGAGEAAPKEKERTKEKEKEKEKPSRKNPFKIEPAQKPGPKGEIEEGGSAAPAKAPERTKEKEKEKPKTKNPFKIEPAQKPGPKGRAPKWLSFDTFTKLGYNLK
jgi:hypothetical protein